ncbi:MAG: diaminopimelate decarboxylase [Gemmatimonadetes bacterium]|nr:diaminopimelate decarboxylase [Gemmatimonadota bacterium]
MGQGVLALEGVGLAAIAEAVGTPAYVYSAGQIREQYRTLERALAPVPHRICYSVKANGNLAILALMRSLRAGVDIVSAGELARALAAGFAGPDVVFSGVGKTAAELEAALAARVGLISVESEEELTLLAELVRRSGVGAAVAIRVNPEVTVETHPYTATGERGKKFGVPYDEAESLARRAAQTPGLSLVGLAMHIGSQLTHTAPFVDGTLKLLELVDGLRRCGVETLTTLDLGGGLGIRYQDSDRPPDAAAFADAVLPHVAASGLTVVVEPGRFLVGNAGVLLTRLLYRKRSGGRVIAVVDAGMSDLLRPSHYQAYHEITVDGADGRPREPCDVVGPICESGDFFAMGRNLPRLEVGDLLAVGGAGAYGFVMSSTYNARPRPPEVLVDGDRFAVIRDRETAEDLMRGECPDPAWVRRGRADPRTHRGEGGQPHGGVPR